MLFLSISKSNIKSQAESDSSLGDNSICHAEGDNILINFSISSPRFNQLLETSVSVFMLW